MDIRKEKGEMEEVLSERSPVPESDDNAVEKALDSINEDLSAEKTAESAEENLPEGATPVSGNEGLSEAEGSASENADSDRAEITAAVAKETVVSADDTDPDAGDGKKKSRKGLIAILATLGILAGGAAAYFGYGYYHYENRFIDGTIINGIDAGEMTPEEVETILKDKVEDYEIKVSFRDGSAQTVKADDIDFVYVSDQTTKRIIENQEWTKWGLGRLLGETWEYTAGEAFKVDEEKIKNVVLAFPEFKEENLTAPTNAYLRLAEDNTIQIVPETQGNYPFADPATEAVKAAVLREEENINIADVAGAYAVPEVVATDQGLVDQQNMLNSFLGTTVTYNMPDGTQKVLDRAILKDWITIEENGFITLDEDRIKENCENYATQTASETDFLKSTRIFNSTNRGQLELSCDTWGRRLDQEAEAAQLLSDLLSGTSEAREPIYSMNTTVDDTFGGNYIEVDLASQHVYCYMDGSLFYDAPCVSGTNSVPSRRTVTGIFEIYMKERNRILRGANQEYASFVDFWMPFYEGYGLHNAPWRGEFGGDIYEYSGSHGCVNLSYGAAETIWNNYAVGTPVIVF